MPLSMESIAKVLFAVETLKQICPFQLPSDI
jgi:hypothetical protein